MLYSHSAYEFLANEDSFAKFLEGFEQGTLPRPRWSHAAHLAVASWYLLSLPQSVVMERVRSGIQHYNECAGIRNTRDSGYHETLTRFWLDVVGRFLSSQTGSGERPSDKIAAMRRVVAEFGGQRDLFRQYYSFDVIASREARARWVPPDRIPCLPGNKSPLESI